MKNCILISNCLNEIFQITHFFFKLKVLVDEHLWDLGVLSNFKTSKKTPKTQNTKALPASP